MEKEKQNLKIIIFSVIIVLLLGVIGYLLLFNTKEEEKIDNPSNVKGEDNIVSIDYDVIEKKLINSKKHIYLETCDSCEGIDYDNYDKTVCHKKELSTKSITTLINKLKKAKKVEILSTSKPCSLYTFYVEDGSLIAFEADDPSILLVGLENNGYAYYFDNEDIREFLKKLN